MEVKGRSRYYLSWILFLAVFMNGFEAAGYQTSLSNIGKEYDLNDTAMGILASFQLIAGLIAPLVFGPLADKLGKKRLLAAFFAAESAACTCIVLCTGYRIFAAGIFLMGLCVSTIQYVSIAALADMFPVSADQKIGWITGFYSLGAVIAPLICGSYLGSGFSWRILFVIIGISAVIEIIAALVMDFSPRETARISGDKAEPVGAWILSGILLLCAVMFVYVGFENGFAFFINPYLTDIMKADHAYIGLSLFWLAMIPARILCGYFSRWNRQILISASLGAAVLSLLIGVTTDGTVAIVLCLPLGFFCGAIYPSVLSRSLDFAGGKTATATGMITAATGLGGAAITALTGLISQQFGINRAFIFLSLFISADFFISLLLFFGHHSKGIKEAPGK
jgi:FHS family glucose/mannose:H+ symporter-like MFS transporter